jgi:hypothetical protein
MKAIDIRSESAVKLLAEFLDMDNEPEQRRVNAEHFAHGESYLGMTHGRVLILSRGLFLCPITISGPLRV